MVEFCDVFPRNELPLAFILTIGLRWFIGLVGFVFNFSLVYVTWKTKTFRQLCNYLISANAFFSGLFGLSLSIGWAFVLSGQPFLFEDQCVILQTVPLLCRNLGLSLLFWLGFDRLICALFANSFFHRRRSVYLFLIIAGSSIHGGFIAISVFIMAINYPKRITLCSTHDDIYVGPLSLTLMLINVILSINIFLVYCILALVVKFKKDTSVSAQITRRLLRSLMAIMLVVVAGFTLNNFVNVLYVSMPLQITAIAKAYTSLALSCLMAMAYASNAPLLIMFSTEYRKAYRRTFGPILERFHLVSVGHYTKNSTQNVQQTLNNAVMLNNNNNRNSNSSDRANKQKQRMRTLALAKVKPFGNY